MNRIAATSDRDDGWGMTLAFWGTLLAAGALFAAVSLAPKLKRLADLDTEFAENQLRLVELERQAIELERVAEALEHDPKFATELAKLEFAAGRSAGERIAVPAPLRLGAEAPATAKATLEPNPSRFVSSILLDPLATHGGMRGTLLAFAVGLVLVAFLMLNEAQAAMVSTVVRNSGETIRSFTDRYRKPPAGGSPVVRRKKAA